MTVECIYCGAKIVLNEDTPDMRAAGQDPRHQLKQHIVTRHSSADIVKHHYATGFILDMLFFRCPSDPARWRANIDATLSHFLESKNGTLEN